MDEPLGLEQRARATATPLGLAERQRVGVEGAVGLDGVGCAYTPGTLTDWQAIGRISLPVRFMAVDEQLGRLFQGWWCHLHASSPPRACPSRPFRRPGASRLCLAAVLALTDENARATVGSACTRGEIRSRRAASPSERMVLVRNHASVRNNSARPCYRLLCRHFRLPFPSSASKSTVTRQC